MANWDEESCFQFTCDLPSYDTMLERLRRQRDAGKMTPAQAARHDEVVRIAAANRPLYEALLRGELPASDMARSA